MEATIYALLPEEEKKEYKQKRFVHSEKRFSLFSIAL